MVAQSDRSSVILIDPLNSDEGHPVDDDLFLAECLQPITDRLKVVASPNTAERLRQDLKVSVQAISRLDRSARFQRLRLFGISLRLSTKGFRHVIFQSFEEVSALLFMLLHPWTKVHVIVTSNLRPDRLWRHPVAGRFFLSQVFRRAASVVVHSQHEVETIRTLVPGIEPDKVLVKPFHQFSIARQRRGWHEKERRILFLGPECSHKQVGPVLHLIERDEKCQFSYVFAGMHHSFSSEDLQQKSTRSCEVLAGHVNDEQYYRLFSEATLVMLTHDRGYEGALSGAFCDAVASGTPIIARDMEPFKEFFDRFGPMGFLVDYDDPNWQEQVLTADLEGRYEEFQDNMAALRGASNMDAVRSIFRTALRQG